MTNVRTRRSALLALLSLAPLTSAVAQPQTSASAQTKLNVTRDLPYADPAAPRQKVNIYAPEGAKNLPVVLWIHGGGWQTGDRTNVQVKPQAFVNKDFAFISTGYRLLPNVEMAKLGHRQAMHAQPRLGGLDDGRPVVGVAVHGNAALDDGEGKSLGLQIAIVDANQSGELRASGVAHDENSLWVAAVLGNVVMHPADGFGDVAKDADHLDVSAQAERLEAVLKDAGIPTRRFAARETNHNKLNEARLPSAPATCS